MIKKLFLAILITVSIMNGFSQIAINQYSGKVFQTTSNNDAVGSPYLFDDWQPAKVFLVTGEPFEARLKFDALRNKFYFTRNDTTFELGDDVTEVKLKNPDGQEMDFRKIITTDSKRPMAGFVQVLATGKVPLYKEYLKRAEGENYTNGIFTSEKKIVSHNSIWTIINNETVPVKINSHSLEELTADKKDQVLDYVKSNKLNPKNEKDFASALAYYNSLFKG